MSIFYDLIFLLFAILYLPIFLFKKKLHPGFSMRLGLGLGVLPRYLESDRPVWIHAVSVGEVMAVRSLIKELRNKYPHKKFLISTITPTGNKIARSIAQQNDFVFYLPLDLSFIIKNTVDRINPSIFIITETELWPNLIRYLHRKNIPTVLVNGRISDSSFKGYLAIKFLLRHLLKKVSLFCVQTPRDAQRLVALGVAQSKIRVTGNMKFDVTGYPDSIILTYPNRDPDSDKFRGLSRDTDYNLKLGLESNEKLFIAASTHHGEEKIILGVYKNLLAEFTNLRLLIAPRHPQRAKEIERLVIKYGFNPARLSQSLDFARDGSRDGELVEPLASGLVRGFNPQTVFILDTVGQLLTFYSIADIVFVGGSLIRKGGHNILEPALFGKPILFGPHMFNFRDIADLFLQNQACLLVHNKEELETGIRDLLNSPSIIEGMSKRAKDLIRQNQGATKRNLEYIMSYK